MNYPSPLNPEPVELAFALQQWAGQEGNDGEPYDMMMAAAKEIGRLCKVLNKIDMVLSTPSLYRQMCKDIDNILRQSDAEES